MKTADSISVPTLAIAFASIAADQDLIALAKARLVANSRIADYLPGARRIRAYGGGNLIVTYRDDPSTSITHVVPTGGSLVVEGLFLAIKNGTTATLIVAEF